MKVIMLYGNCGVGKTWIMLEILKKLKNPIQEKIGKFRFIRSGAIALIGVYDGSTFQGSDRLSMSLMSDLDDFLAYAKEEKLTVIGEGDRLMNKTFIGTAKPRKIKVAGDGKEGRKKRGSDQTSRHLKSIATRVSNIEPDILAMNSQEALSLLLVMIKKKLDK